MTWKEIFSCVIEKDQCERFGKALEAGRVYAGVKFENETLPENSILKDCEIIDCFNDANGVMIFGGSFESGNYCGYHPAILGNF